MDFKSYPSSEKQLGIIYDKEKTIFRIWSPYKDNIKLLLYRDAYTPWREEKSLIKSQDGVFEIVIFKDLKGYFYNYLIDNKYEVTDPYSISSSMNSLRSAIIDLEDSNPLGWDQIGQPSFEDENPIIYEVHVKDFTFHESSGAKARGKYLGFVEENTKYKDFQTGINHLKDLGINYVHLLPIHDFLTVREEKEYFYHDDNFNWGYDPELYNVPEGSYSLDSEDPLSRIRELKTLIMKLHEANIGVIVDVVYNHTYRTENSNFNQIVPDYYYRKREDGTFSDGSLCGNELASERPMVRKFIIDSLLYWVREYKVDGFRFDLMGLLDLKTLEKALKSLREINPNILIYGEPWTAGQTTLDVKNRVTKGSQSNLNYGLFNDEFRDAIKGDNDGLGQGFIHGNLDHKQETETGLVGSIYYDDSHIGFTMNSNESINYVNSHDNLIIFDKIKKTLPSADIDFLIRLNKLAFSVLFTSQGIPFIHGGNEFLRSKFMVENSYKSPNSINAIDWSLKETNYDFYLYFKDLIKLRKSYKSFNLKSKKQIIDAIKFIERPIACKTIIYTIISEEINEKLLVIHNTNSNSCILSIDMISKHIENEYGIVLEELKLIPVFNSNGLVKEKQMESGFGIKFDEFSTLVYEII